MQAARSDVAARVDWEQPEICIAASGAAALARDDRGLRGLGKSDNLASRASLLGDVTMLGGLSAFLEEVARRLPPESKTLVWGNLNLTLRDWYTNGISALEAAQRIKRALL